MRFRVVSDPPIKPLKAWFDVPNDGSVINVSGVKSELCSRLPQLPEENEANICLFIDGFELLDDSGLDVIKENDLVHISTKRSGSSSHAGKRKFAYAQVVPTKYSHKKRRIETDSDTDSETDSSSSSSSSPRPTRSHPVSVRTEVRNRADTHTDSSDFDSSSTLSSSARNLKSSSGPTADGRSTETDGSSGEESSSSLGSPLSPLRSSGMRSDHSELVQIPQNELVMHRAPPGQGKPATRSRNARRRIKRMYEKQQRETDQAAACALGTDSVNAMPLGVKHNGAPVASSEPNGNEQTPAQQEASPIEVENMVTSLKNKNKKKGFKSSMAGVVPQRTLFSDGSDAPPESSLTTFVSRTLVPATRLIAPSEKQAMGLLPANMFVTSVEVESENWDKKKKTRQRNLYGSELIVDEVIVVNDNTILNYGEAEIDWASVDGKWEKLQVASPSSLASGTLVGWKALAINPVTFTPEGLVHLARVKEVKHDSSSIVVEPIHRPGSEGIAFGASVDAPKEGAEGDNALVEEVTYTFDDVLREPWRLVNI